jgi:DNA-binding NarL/FixJ family response regulator
MRHLVARLHGSEIHLVSLSPREAEVVGLVARGLPNKEIGYRLHMAVGTVKSHISTITAALGLHNRTELCVWILSHPEALSGLAVEPGLHLPGCTCAGPYCVAMRPAS